MRASFVVLAVALAFAAPGTARAQDAGAGPIYIDPADLLGAPEVSAAASPSEVQLGSRFVLLVTAAYDEGITVNLPSRLDLGAAFEERRRTSTEKTRSDGKKIREWQIEVLAWDLGEMDIPPVQVTFVAGGAASAVLTNAVPMRVIGTLGDMVDDVKPREMAGPVQLWRRTWFWVIVAAVGVVAIMVLILAIVVYRRRKRRPLYTVPVAARTSGLFRRPRLSGPAEEALARLEAIDTSGMLARDRKVAYIEMIDVMQEFLGRQLGGDTTDMTTGELRAWLAGTSVADGTRVELMRWLDDADLVKFGGLAATVDEGRGHLVVARDLVVAVAMPAAVAAGTIRGPDEPVSRDSRDAEAANA